MARLSGNCQKCGTWRRSLHRDHIIPRYKGGGDEPENIQCLCANCHEEKTADDMKGHPVSEEQKANQSRKMKGRKASEATKRKLSDLRRGKPLGPWSQARKDSVLKERRERWTPERKLAHSIIGQKEWASLTEKQRSDRVANIASSRTVEQRRAHATKASLVAKSVRDALTPEQKLAKRIRHIEIQLAKIRAQMTESSLTEE